GDCRLEHRRPQRAQPARHDAQDLAAEACRNGEPAPTAADLIALLVALLVALFADRARIARRPAARLDAGDEVGDRLVEQRRLLLVHHMAGLGQHHQARRRDPLLEMTFGSRQGSSSSPTTSSVGTLIVLILASTA